MDGGWEVVVVLDVEEVEDRRGEGLKEVCGAEASKRNPSAAERDMVFLRRKRVGQNTLNARIALLAWVDSMR